MDRSTRRVLRTTTLTAAASLFCASATLAMPGFTNWSLPINVEALPGSALNVNTPAVDGCVSLSRDGSELYFNSSRGGNQDLYVAYRSTFGDGFGSPERLPSPINTTADEFCPTITPGGDLYFSRASAIDPGDLFVSRVGPKGWRTPTNLGSNINSPLMDEVATFYEDVHGRRVMLFSRRQVTGAGGIILMSVEGGPATPLGGGTSSQGSDNRPSVTHDGLTIFFDSTRSGGLGGPDIWFATRDSTDAPFGPATNLTLLNSPVFDARPSVSWDGSELLFSSNRLPGSESPAPDIWWTSRDKIPGGPKIVEF